MTKLLQTMIETLDRLPEDMQDRYATQFLAELTRDEVGTQTVMEQAPRRKRNAKAGSAKGLILYMAEDFDAPLEDFKDYT